MEPPIHRPFVIVVSAPSGTGKTTICRRALEQLDRIRFSVSHTTRCQRDGEQHGHDYFFVDLDEFESLRSRDRFLESANVYGNYYGTSRDEVDRAASDGIDLLVEIDVQGAEQIIDALPDAVSVFILPPSAEELERRLRGRGTDSEDDIRRRLQVSMQELERADRYKYRIVNDDLDAAVAELVAVISNERSSRSAVATGADH